MNDATSRRGRRHLQSLGGGFLLACGAALAASCGGSSKATTGAGGGGTGAAAATSGTATSGSVTGTGHTSSSATGTGPASGSATSTTGTGGASAASTSGTGGASSSATSGGGGSATGLPAGWLYTSGSKIYVSDGHAGGTPWMGRGANTDDIFLCGYNYELWMGANAEPALQTMTSGLISAWKPNFVRISLGMDSEPTVVSWLSNAAQYKTPMTSVIDALGKNAGVYVLVTLRSDASMIGQDTADGDAEATGLPSDGTTTPDKTNFPTGTDAVYTAIVDTFANDSYVLFGLTNEPGGDKLTNAQISAAMSHAVGVIRAEEDKLGVPHHLVSVQGNGWTSDISFYAQTPLPYDNVVYEVHGYPPATASYTYANIPVILGEYGSLPSGGEAAFYADVEAKQIPNLAWDFDSYSDCAPDLLNVNQSSTNLVPSTWGSVVQAYLLAHAQ